MCRTTYVWVLLRVSLNLLRLQCKKIWTHRMVSNLLSNFNVGICLVQTKRLTKRPNVSWSWKVSSLNIKFSYFCTLVFSNKTHAACKKCLSQPNYQTKCWQCLFLHNNWYVKTFKFFVAMLQVFVSLGSAFNSILWQHCASTLVSFRHWKHWLGLGKDHVLFSKYPFWSPQTQLENFGGHF